MVERSAVNRLVVGSNPTAGAIYSVSCRLALGFLENAIRTPRLSLLEFGINIYLMNNFPFHPGRTLLMPLIAVVLLLIVTTTMAAPENTVIVVNADSWASTRIANEYIRARGIPPFNVIYLKDLPSFDRMEVEDFRVKILLPVLLELEKRGLMYQSDVIVYSSDFPTMIDVSKDAGSKKLPPILSPYASINSLTYHLAHVLNRSVGYISLDQPNFYARRMQSPATLDSWTDEQKETQAKASNVLNSYKKLLEEQRKANGGAPPGRDPSLGNTNSPATGDSMQEVRKKISASADTLIALKKYHAYDSDLHFEIARFLALLERPDEAMAALKESSQNGWFDAHVTESHDEDFKSLQGRTDFKDLMTLMKGRKFELLPTMGLRGNDFLGKDGKKITVDHPGQGMFYVISTVLAVTSGRGNSVEEALASLKRSVAADGTHPTGTVFFMKNDDVRSWTREWGFQRAVEKLADEGVKAEILDGVIPKGKRDVAGVCVGSPGFNWSDSGSTILPGAICEHLTSLGGVMTAEGFQTPLTEFIRHGASGASGTVVEPFSIQDKFPTPFIQYFYARGCSLGEAFYQSLATPYQTLIVGDALCRPWGRRIEVRAKGVAPGSAIRGVVRITPSAKSPDGIETDSFELYSGMGILMMKVKLDESFELDTTKLPDGPQELAVIARGADTLGTQGRMVLPVNVRNRKEELAVIPPKRRDYAWDERVEIKVSLSGATSLALIHNGRFFGEIPGDKGTVIIPAALFGQGPVRLFPVAFIGGEKSLGNMTLGKPIDLTITAPKALPPIDIPAGQQLAEGFLIQAEGKAPVTSTRSQGDWLDKAGIGKEDNFTLDAWFSVPETDVYQFQLYGDVEIDSRVDDKEVGWPTGKGWCFIPVHLEKGLHHLSLKVLCLSSKPGFEIRFGGKGTRWMDGSLFRHLEPIPANS